MVCIIPISLFVAVLMFFYLKRELTYPYFWPFSSDTQSYTMAIFGRSKSHHHRPEETAPSVSDVDKLSIKDPEPGYGGQFKDFLKTVISFTGDLSSLTCPAFFLNGLSLLEYG